MEVTFDFHNGIKGVWVIDKCVKTSRQVAIICYLRFGFLLRIHLGCAG